MSTYNWHKLLVDRGLMTKSEETTFGEKSTLYHQRKYKSLDKSQMEPFFGQENLQYHRRKCSYLAFQHDSIVDLVHSISSRRAETGRAGHLIPPRKSKDEEVLAWKVYLPDIIK